MQVTAITVLKKCAQLFKYGRRGNLKFALQILSHNNSVSGLHASDEGTSPKTFDDVSQRLSLDIGTHERSFDQTFQTEECEWDFDFDIGTPTSTSADNEGDFDAATKDNYSEVRGQDKLSDWETVSRESSSETLNEQLLKAEREAIQARSEAEESAKRIAELESQLADCDKYVQINTLHVQIEELQEKLKKAEEALSCPTLSIHNPEAGSPKTQSEDEYIVVEQERTGIVQSKLNEKEREIGEATALAKRFEEMYKTAEEKTSNFERQVADLEANIREKIDDANVLLDKVVQMEELLSAGQIKIDSQQAQIATLEEKSKSIEDAQKKVEYEKVLFLETEDQLVKNFKKAHDEAERYRNMIFQLEMSVKIAEEKAAHHESCADLVSQRNQELEAERSDLNSRLKSLGKDWFSHGARRVNANAPLMELEKLLKVYQDILDSFVSKVSQLEHELQLFKERESKLEEDLRSMKEKTIVNEAEENQLIQELEKLHEVQESKFVCEAHSSRLKNKLSDDLSSSQGRGSTFEEEMKSLEENVVAYAEHSSLLMAELVKLKSIHIMYVCDAEVGHMQLRAHAKDLGENISRLERDLETSRGSVEKLEREVQAMEHELEASRGWVGTLEGEVKAMEEKASSHEENSNHWFLEFGKLQGMHAEQLCSIEEKVAELNAQANDLMVKTNMKEGHLEASEQRVRDLEEELKSAREKFATYEIEEKRWARDSERLWDAERRTAIFEAQANDLEAKLGFLERELEASRGNEVKLTKDLKYAAEQSVAQELRRNSLASKLETIQTLHNLHMQNAKAQCIQLEEHKQDLEQKVIELEQELKSSQERECNLQENLISMEEKYGANIEVDKFETTRDVGDVTFLEYQVGQLKQELQISKGREEELHNDNKCMEEKVVVHEQISFNWMNQATKQGVDHDTQVQVLEAQIRVLEEELGQAKTQIGDRRLWAQEVTNLLSVHAEFLGELKELFSHPERHISAFKVPGEVEMETLNMKVKALHSDLSNIQPSDGFEALHIYSQLLSLLKEDLISQMVSMAQSNVSLVTEVEKLSAQLQERQTIAKLPMKEQKKSFREVTLDGELQALRAQKFEIASLHSSIKQMQHNLRASEARELQQSLDLAREQRKVVAALEEICSLKNLIVNEGSRKEQNTDTTHQLVIELEAQIFGLREQVTVLEGSILLVEVEKSSLQDEINSLVQAKAIAEIETHDMAFSEPTSDRNQVSDELFRASKSSQRKARKRKASKNVKNLQSKEVVPVVDAINPSIRGHLSLCLLFVVLVAIVIMLGLS